VADYERHQPEKTLLHGVISEQLEGFLASAARIEQPISRFIEQSYSSARFVRTNTIEAQPTRVAKLHLDGT